MEYNIRENKYRVISDIGKTITDLDLLEIVTDYYDRFDYIVGDWAYGKVRLKGFYNDKNKNTKEHNNIKNLDEYIKNKCAYGCKYFVLEKIKNKKVEKEK